MPPVAGCQREISRGLEDNVIGLMDGLLNGSQNVLFLEEVAKDFLLGGFRREPIEDI